MLILEKLFSYIWKLKVAAAITSEMKTPKVFSVVSAFMFLIFASKTVLGRFNWQSLIYGFIPNV
jgi:hypothetical protein